MFRIKTLVGYEYNYLKSPNKLIVDDNLVLEKELINSSIYQDIILNFDYLINWKKSKLETKILPKYKAYFQNLEDSYFNILATSKYNYNITQNTSLLAGVSFKKVIREGFDSDQDVIVSPLGYNNSGASVGLQLQPIKNNKTKAAFFYNYRDFNKYKTRDTYYNEIGLSINTEQFIIVNKQIHTYGINGFYKKTKLNTINTEDQNLNSKRNWSFLMLNPFYKVKLNRNIEITPSIHYYLRTDKENLTSFSQIGPELKLKLIQSKTRATFVFSYLIRNYKHLEAKDFEGFTENKINLNFIKFNLIFVHDLTKSISINANLFSRIRTTNYTNLSSRSFSHFRNQYAAIGINWKI